MRARVRTTLALALPLALPFALPRLSSGAHAPQSGLGYAQDGTDQDDTTPDDDLPPDESTPGVDPGNGDLGAYDIFGRRRVRTGNTFEERLQGGWQLVEMSLPNSDSRGRVAQGFLHIGAGFLSMEIHAAWNVGTDTETAALAESDLHTTFTAEYQLTGTRLMRCSTVIGSYLDEETGELQWERAGYEREYRVQEDAGRLVLGFGQPGAAEGRLVFEPRLPADSARTDIFGRKLQPGAGFGDVDIFGREIVTPRTGDVDIFGRPVKGEDDPPTETPPKEDPPEQSPPPTRPR